MIGFLDKRIGLKVGYYLLITYFSYLMILITIQYIPLELNVAFLKIKQEEIQLKHYQIAFFTHVYTSIIVHLAGITQFSGYLRKKFTALHRYLGFIYVVGVLFFASPSGLVMGYYANGGLIAQISFSVLAVLWFYFTLVATIAAKKKDWKTHQKHMLRSYALTLSAVTLRIFKWVISNTLELPPMDTYQVVSIAGWVVNLLVVEWYIRRFQRHRFRTSG